MTHLASAFALHVGVWGSNTVIKTGNHSYSERCLVSGVKFTSLLTASIKPRSCITKSRPAYELLVLNGYECRDMLLISTPNRLWSRLIISDSFFRGRKSNKQLLDKNNNILIILQFICSIYQRKR